VPEPIPIISVAEACRVEASSGSATTRALH
jgi:hypothetical protein